ncbi:hypothetical protein G9A89_021800 [Geosiphon pyriformis]|nr:hypothetical protein G9A89_021800 [Geosiphon pyriformis]
MPISEVFESGVFFEITHSLKWYGIAFIKQLLNRKGVYFNWKCFRHWKHLDPSSASFLDSGSVSFDVYTNSSVKHFGSNSVVAEAAAFFLNVNIGVKACVYGIMLSILAELKAIALALACIPLESSVVIYSDSQAAISACCYK